MRKVWISLILSLVFITIHTAGAQEASKVRQGFAFLDNSLSDTRTGAHAYLPVGTLVQVTNLNNNRQVTVVINRRLGPGSDRLIDLSPAAAAVIGLTGYTWVEVRNLSLSSLNSQEDALVDGAESSAGMVFIPPPPESRYAGSSTPNGVPAPSAVSGPELFVARSFPPNPQASRSVWETRPQPVRSGPAARVIPRMPAPNDRRHYIVQVGSFEDRRGAGQAFRTLTNAGLRPAHERFGRYNRVVLPNVPAGDIPFLARYLGAMGFKEIWIRK